jgi:hypothetical protein
VPSCCLTHQSTSHVAVPLPGPVSPSGALGGVREGTVRAAVQLLESTWGAHAVIPSPVEGALAGMEGCGLPALDVGGLVCASVHRMAPSGAAVLLLRVLLQPKAATTSATGGGVAAEAAGVFLAHFPAGSEQLCAALDEVLAVRV